MRHGVIQVHEEGAGIGALDEGLRFLREEVVGVVLLEIDSHPLAVAPQVIGELPVGMALVAEPEGVLEALPSRAAPVVPG